MASVDLRIRRSARRSRERWAQHGATKYASLRAQKAYAKLLERQDLEELRELLNDEIANMQDRFTRALALRGRITLAERRRFVKHLHMLTFDETYRDYYGVVSKNDRSRQRIESLLVLCHGNEALFLKEYARALDKFFPVESWSAHYVWNPKLIERKLKSGKTRVSLRHHMSYRKRVEQEDSGGDASSG